jgi:hypothetical protein
MYLTNVIDDIDNYNTIIENKNKQDIRNVYNLIKIRTLKPLGVSGSRCFGFKL